MGKVSIAIAGMASLSPEARRTHLANQIKTANFSRTNEDGFGEKTKVFHVASAIDPANLAPLPLASVKGGQLITAMSMRQVEQAMLVPFLASMKDEPLGDGMVSLPNAIVPRAFRPQNLEVKLIALTTFDHFGLQLTRRSDETAGRSPPYAKIVDAIIEGVGPAIGGSAESSADGEGKAKSEVEKCFGSPKPSYMDDRWSCRSPCKWVCESCEAEGPDPEEACR